MTSPSRSPCGSPQDRSALCHSPREEAACCYTHALGTVLGALALVIMLMSAWGDGLRIVAAAVFGTALMLLYGASTWYHAVTSPRLKEPLQILDHACIYILIAGSYTPVTLITLRGPWGWTLLALVWFLAIAGIVLKLIMRGKRDSWVSTLLYLGMGWLAVIAIGPLIQALAPGGLALLVAGGLFYTGGVIFYVWKSLPFHHAIWHLFVLAGSACHVAAVTLHVLPG